jgi:L-alanine-DL-glutamate epimerase-like enolase superfamily enzyme
MLAQFFPWTVDTIFKQPLQTDPRHIRVPDRPGLGVEVDLEKLAAYRI